MAALDFPFKSGGLLLDKTDRRLGIEAARMSIGVVMGPHLGVQKDPLPWVAFGDQRAQARSHQFSVAACGRGLFGFFGFSFENGF